MYLLTVFKTISALSAALRGSPTCCPEPSCQSRLRGCRRASQWHPVPGGQRRLPACSLPVDLNVPIGASDSTCLRGLGGFRELHLPAGGAGGWRLRPEAPPWKRCPRCHHAESFHLGVSVGIEREAVPKSPPYGRRPCARQ